MNIQPIKTNGFFAEPLGTSVIINNYHKFMFHFNLTELVSSYNNIYATTSSLLHKANNTFPYLFLELTKSLENTNKNLNKLLPQKQRMKRGLINGLGKIIKFVSGNLDQNDLDYIQTQLDSLKNNRNQEFQYINKLITFSNTISNKLSDEMNHVNLNMGILKEVIQKDDFQIGILEHYQYILMCLSKLQRIIDTFENTISLSFSDVTNVELFSTKDIEDINLHLRLTYPERAIVQTDSHYPYELLKTTKTQVVMLDSDMIVVLSVPITDGDQYHLYAIYPVPTVDKIVLVPPEKYHLQGAVSKWSDAPCVKNTRVYICNTNNIRITGCNLTNTVNCEFATVQNDVKLFQLLSDEKIIFFSTKSETLLQICTDSQNVKRISGPQLITSNTSCPISTMGITLEPKPTNIVCKMPSFLIQSELKITQQIHFHHTHLDPDKLKFDIQPIMPPIDLLQHMRGFDIIFCVIIFCILFLLLILFRKRMYSLIVDIKNKLIKAPEDSSLHLRGEELCSLDNPVIGHAVSSQNTSPEYGF